MVSSLCFQSCGGKVGDVGNRRFPDFGKQGKPVSLPVEMRGLFLADFSGITLITLLAAQTARFG